MKLPKYLFRIVIPLLLLSACGNRADDKAIHESKVAMDSVDELLATHSEQARHTIDNGIASAKDSMTRYEYEARLARFYYLSPTPDSMLPILKRVETFAKNKTDDERGRQLLAYAYNTHAVYYHAFHLEPNKQKKLYRESYNIIMASEDKSEAHKVAANLADAYTADNELPQAAAWYRRALFLVDSLQLPAKENSTLYMGLAGIYQQLGDNDQALKYYKQTEEVYKTMPIGMQAYFLNNYGSYYYYIHDYKKALAKFLAMHKLLEDNKMQNNFDMYLCRINLADVYLNLGETAEASRLLDEVEPFAKKYQDPAILYYCNSIRIGIAVKEKKWDVVKQLSTKDTNSNGISFQMRNIRAQYMRDYYIANGNYAQAYRDLLSDDNYNDSLEHNRVNMRTADIMAMFTADTLQLHHDLRMQQQKSAFDRAKLTSIVAITVVIVLVLLLMLYIQRNRKKTAEDRNKIMDLRLQGARIRISPHFIFNVLNNHIITTKNKEEDAEILELSKLIRKNLNLSREIAVSLSEELEFVRQYVRVEQPLVGDDLDFSVNIADNVDIDKVLIPSMMMQILVENAFVHALSGWDGHKMLHIDITRSGSSVTIAVTDNGKGFTAASLQGRNHNGLNIIRQTIAVFNSRHRHKMIFNMQNVTDNGVVKGCRSTITIPDGVLKRDKK